MYRQIRLLVVLLGTGGVALQGQEFKVFNRTVQVHGFASQGFVHTDVNNWLTMRTSNIGSGEFTDFGVNVSTQITDKFRIGAQIYDRNLGSGLGRWRPLLDWAVADYRVTSWFGVRGGKVKTVRGLYNDTQDQDFLHTFALLPQGVYPIDMRECTIAHEGGDIYGNVELGKKFGTLSYTGYIGNRRDEKYSGYAYMLKSPPLSIDVSHYGGLQYGLDLRWRTPLKGALVGISRMNQHIEGYGTTTAFGPVQPYHDWTTADWVNQYYGQYSRGKLRMDAEYRRYWQVDMAFNGLFPVRLDVRGWYVAGSYRLTKWFQFGSYYSNYSLTVPPIALLHNLVQHGQENDKVVAGRFDLNRFFNLKIEGHFIDGAGLPGSYPDGFYASDNPQGLKPDTNALVVRTGFSF